jgi:hypothetical protein
VGRVISSSAQSELVESVVQSCCLGLGFGAINVSQPKCGPQGRQNTTDTSIQDEIREMGAALISHMNQIPFYNTLASLRTFGLPSKDSVYEAARELNGIAYETGPVGRSQRSASENVKALEKVARLLRIRTAYQ